MAPSAQPDVEQGQGFKVLKLNMKNFLMFMYILIVSKGVWQAFSSDELIDPQMSLDPQFLVPMDDSVGSDSTQSTHLTNKYNDTSLKLPSTEDNSGSLIETKEFLDFVDELSQEPLPLSDREGTSKPDDTVPSVKVEDSLHSIDVVEKPESVKSSLESQDISIDKVPKRMVLSLQTFYH